jgi:hypothetical protein
VFVVWGVHYCEHFPTFLKLFAFTFLVSFFTWSFEISNFLYLKNCNLIHNSMGCLRGSLLCPASSVNRIIMPVKGARAILMEPRYNLALDCHANALLAVYSACIFISYSSYTDLHRYMPIPSAAQISSPAARSNVFGMITIDNRLHEKMVWSSDPALVLPGTCVTYKLVTVVIV